MDTSYSMGLVEKEKSRLEICAEEAAKILDNSRSGQRFMIIPFSDGISEDGEWTTDVQRSREILGELRATGETTNVLKTLRQVSAMGERSSAFRIWVFSDLQRHAWLDVLQALRQEDSFAKELPEVILFPVGAETGGNAWLERGKSASLPLARGEAVPLSLGARMSGYDSAHRLDCRLHVEGTLELPGDTVVSCSVYDRRLQLQGQEIQILSVPFVPIGTAKGDASPEGTVFGIWKGESRIDCEDGRLDHLSYDDAVNWSVPVLWSLPVALVKTSENSVAGHILEICLSPFPDAEGFFVKGNSISSTEIGKTDLSRFPVVVLQENVWEELDLPSRESLLRYVREGGFLVSFVTDRGSFEIAEACGVTASEIESGTTPMVLSEIDWSHPVMSTLTGFGEDAGESVSIYEGVAFQNLDSVWISARASGGESLEPVPVAGEKSYEKGKVVFWGVGLESERSDFASSVLFLPLIHGTLKYLVADSVSESVDQITPAGSRQESVLERMTGEEMLELDSADSIVLLGKNKIVDAKKRTDLVSWLLGIVIFLAVAETWVSNRRV